MDISTVQITLDLPEFEIEAALSRGDVNQLKDIGSRMLSKEEFLSHLGVHAFNARSQRRQGRVGLGDDFHSMFMWPVLLPQEHSQKITTDVITQVQRELHAALQTLAYCSQQQVEVSGFSVILTYEQVCSLDPHNMRHLVNGTVLGLNSIGELDVETSYPMLNTPTEAPALAFMAGCVKTSNTWFDFTAISAEAHIKAAALVSTSLKYAFDIDEQPQSGTFAPRRTAGIECLLPAHAQEAITKGLEAWVLRLHEQATIESWDLNFAPATYGQPDTLVMLIRTSEFNDPVLLPLRLYQIQHAGLTRLLSTLSDCAGRKEIFTGTKQ